MKQKEQANVSTVLVIEHCKTKEWLFDYSSLISSWVIRNHAGYSEELKINIEVLRPVTIESLLSAMNSDEYIQVDGKVISKKKVHWIIVATHGSVDAIYFGSTGITTKELINKITECFSELRWIHFGACNSLSNLTLDDAKFVISGYENEIDFVNSSMFEMKLFNEAFKRNGTVKDISEIRCLPKLPHIRFLMIVPRMLEE